MPDVPKIALAAVLALTISPAGAQQRAPNQSESAMPTPSYVDYADLIGAAPVVVDAIVRNDHRLKPVDAPGLPQTMARLYIEADVIALIRGTGSVSTRISYTVDVPVDARGRVPRYKKARVLLFARGVAGNAGQVQLVRPDGQRVWTAGGEAITRRIVREVLAADAPPVVTGIGNAIHSAGDVPGEGETQIFLSTADNRPISLNIVRKSGQPPRWSVALGEVAGDAAPPPPRDTLLWYRLVCTLPAALPESVVASTGADAAIAREDYGLVVRSLGRCDRGERVSAE